MAVLDTLVHGGVNAYQWVNVPLGLTGRVDKKDGSVVWIDYGFDAEDPVLPIPDLAPHVDRDFRSRTRAEAIKREEVDPLINSAPAPGGEDDAESEGEGDGDDTNAAATDAMAPGIRQRLPSSPRPGFRRVLRVVAGSRDRLDPKIRADLARQNVPYLGMPWNRTAAVPSLVPPPGVAPPLTDPFATLSPKMPQEGSSLHATTTFSSL